MVEEQIYTVTELKKWSVENRLKFWSEQDSRWTCFANIEGEWATRQLKRIKINQDNLVESFS